LQNEAEARTAYPWQGEAGGGGRIEWV